MTPPNISHQDLEFQFNRVKTNGWIPEFQKTSSTNKIAAGLLMAIASRETNMNNMVGDNNYGYGLGQIDIRSYPAWVASGAWKDPGQSIAQMGVVFNEKLQLIVGLQGKTIHIGAETFTGKSFGGPASNIQATMDMIQKIATASYNAGLWPYFSYSRGSDIDEFTTGKNYSADVWARKVIFDKLLEPTQTVPPKPSFDIDSILADHKILANLIDRVAALEQWKAKLPPSDVLNRTV